MTAVHFRFLAPLLLAAAAGLLFGGCASNGSGELYRFQIADDAAVVSATSLYGPSAIDKATAQNILAGAIAAEAALRTLDAANQTANAAEIASAAAAADAALQALSRQLAGIPPAPGNVSLVRRRLALAPGAPGQSVAAYIAIIQLAAELTPVIVNWLNLATSQASITEAQVAAEFVTLDADIHTLQAAIAAGK